MLEQQLSEVLDAHLSRNSLDHASKFKIAIHKLGKHKVEIICTNHSLQFTEHSFCTDYNTWFGFDNGFPPNLLVDA